MYIFSNSKHNIAVTITHKYTINMDSKLTTSSGVQLFLAILLVNWAGKFSDQCLSKPEHASFDSL